MAQAPFGDVTCVLQDTRGNSVSELVVQLQLATPPLMRFSAPTHADGSYTFRGVPPGSYDLTVAGGLLLPSKRVLIKAPNSTIVLKLPITLPPPGGGIHETVSVEQLSVSEKVREALRKAFEAWERNDLGQSRKLATQVLQLHPDFGPALSLLGMLDLAEGHPADAVIGLEQALRYNPDSPRTYVVLASAYNELHRNNEALSALSIMAKLSPETWQFHYEKGRARLGQGGYQDAYVEFNRAQELAPQELMVLHVGKAHAFLGLRNYDAARTEFETVVRKSPDSPYAADSRRLLAVLDAQRADQTTTAQTSNPEPAPH